MEILVRDYDCVCASGDGMNQVRESICASRSGLRQNDIPRSDLATWIGKVDGLEEYALGDWQSRNNALAAKGLEQGSLMSSIETLIEQYGADRVGIVTGSSTSSIDRTEQAYLDLDDEGVLKPEFQQTDVHNPHAPGLFVAHRTGITGPCLTINTACSSSARVFSTAARWLGIGLVDAVLVGGVDTLCLSVIHGFHSLQLVSRHPCRPFDQNRDGINLGEAAGFALLTNYEATANGTGVVLRGYGESSDAHHMSHPHPQGLGARLAIEDALKRSDLAAGDIDYINLHGTASRANDEIEGRLIEDMFSPDTLCSSTKGWTGHTLGAAGIIESLIALDTLVTDTVPGNLNLEHMDTTFSLNMMAANRHQRVNHVMSNSFGFGGNNCSLVFSRAA